MSNNETNMKTDAINLIRSKKGRALSKVLDQAYNLLAKDDINKFFRFIGECFVGEPYNFLSVKIYPRYHKKIKKLFKKNNSQMLALESYIIQNFSLVQGEQLVDSFSGNISMGGYWLDGRLYLTNLRIIGHGLHQISTTDADGGTSWKTVGIEYRHQRRMYDAISNYLLQKSQYRPCFGYQFPIFGVSAVNRKTKSLKYSCPVDFKSRKENDKSKTYKFRIRASRVRKEENKPDFYIRREQNFDTVEKLFSDLNQLAYQ